MSATRNLLNCIIGYVDCWNLVPSRVDTINDPSSTKAIFPVPAADMASTGNNTDKNGPLYEMKETVTVERGTYTGATAGVTGKIKERIESVGRGWRYVVQTPEGAMINDVAEDDLAPAADP